jgi:uncharacterized heparinase superfamily protein
MMPGLTSDPPAPLFPMRAGMLERSGDAITLCLLNHRESAGPPIDWSARDTGVSGQLWRMHLHYMEFLEEATDAETEAWMLDWIDKNPPTKPGFWRDIWYPYSLSLRSVVWMQQLARRGDRISDAGRAIITQSLVAQIGYLMDHLETDLGGNHLIKNAKALLWASAFFEGPQADRWRKRGTALLLREIPVQILPDGFHFERSAAYHAQVFADLLEIRSFTREGMLAKRLDTVLPPMAQALVDMTHPDGGTTLFNDCGISMAYPPAACLDAYAGLYGDRPVARRIFSYPATGYHGARDDQIYCVVDCGAIGPDDLPAHGHGDVLSFELSLGGARFIVDQGVFEYTAGARRQASRSAAHHNTLCLDDADQAAFFSRFRVGRRPRVKLIEFRADDDGFMMEGEHDGFAHLRGSPRHRRRFLLSGSTLRIDDRIDGTSDRGGRIGFLLHPDVTAVHVSDHSIQLQRGILQALLTCSGPVAIEPAMWWPDLGAEIATSRLVMRLSAADLAERVMTVLNWG